MLRRLRRHDVWRADRNGEGGDDGRHAMQPRHFMGAPAKPLGLQIPQGAIDGVAGRASRQEALQSLPIKPRLQSPRSPSMADTALPGVSPKRP